MLFLISLLCNHKTLVLAEGALAVNHSHDLQRVELALWLGFGQRRLLRLGIFTVYVDASEEEPISLVGGLNHLDRVFLVCILLVRGG